MSSGELDWVALDEDIFADADDVIATAGAAVYSRVTHDMMRGYWPKMLNKPDSREVRHAHWVEQIPKLTFSRSMRDCDWNNVHLRRDAKEILADKQQPGNNLLIFGSPGLVRAFLALDAIGIFPNGYILFCRVKKIGLAAKIKGGYTMIVHAKRWDGI